MRNALSLLISRSESGNGARSGERERKNERADEQNCPRNELNFLVVSETERGKKREEEKAHKLDD